MVCKICEKEFVDGMELNVTAVDTKTGEIIEIASGIGMCDGCYVHDVPLIGATVGKAIMEQLNI